MVKALIFDVFGTCVDWRTSVAAEVAAAGLAVDPLAFADAWRGEYQPAMERIRAGARGYVPLDDLHLENLHIISGRFGVEVDETLNSAWERLDPWPDVVAGLQSLRDHVLIAPCSNGSIGLMARLARHARFPWDCILGADIARDFKPVRDVYRASCAVLGLATDEVMMVAAHNDDLAAARDAGLRTAFVPRPLEYGPDQAIDLTPQSDWDIVAGDFIELAERVAEQAV